MKNHFVIGWHLLFGRGRQGRGLTNWIALISVMIGVAALVTAMAVVSGFAKTLANTVIDVSGHIQIFKQGGFFEKDKDQFLADLKGWGVEPESSTDVFWLEGILTHSGQVSGVIVQGLSEIPSALQKKIVQGRYDLPSFASRDENASEVFIGRILAERMQLKVGDELRIVVPVAREREEQFGRRVGKFRVGGIVSMGKFEYDERIVIAHMPRVQSLVDVTGKVSAFVLTLKNPEYALAKAEELRGRLGFQYRVRDWRELNENLFRAVEIERVGIFFIILVIVIAAAFNVACNLFVAGVQRQSDYAILQAMGVRPRDLFLIVTCQGVIIGLLGALLGLAAGILICQLLIFLQQMFPLMPSSVYRIDHIVPDIRVFDVFSIFFVTVLICGVSAYLPAKKSLRTSPAEGLRYE